MQPPDETSAGYTAERISELTGLSRDQVLRLEALGVVPRDRGGQFTGDALDRVTLAHHAISRGVSEERVGRFCREQPELMASLLSNRAATSRAYTFEEAIARVGSDLLDDSFVDALLDLVGPRPGEPVTDEDIVAMQMATQALHTGFPRDALVQLIRVMAEAADRVADAENRVFHDYVHERNRADGLRGRELFEATDAVSQPLLGMAEPALLYLHRRALHRAMREDFVRHLTEDDRAPVERPGEAAATMLFVDLAGFTPLTLTMGDGAAAELLARFGSMVRSAASRRHGRIVKQIGDAFMLVFDEPADAVGFGVDVCAAVAGESRFPPVHVGAHHGTLLYRDGDYVGTTVNLAARVAGATRPGQFLVTASIAASAVTAGVEARELPAVALKGIDTPTQLFEIVAVEGADQQQARDPVCGMLLRDGDEAATASVDGTVYRFCSTSCRDTFAASPATYLEGP